MSKYDLPEPKYLPSTNRWRISVQRDGVRKSFYSSLDSTRAAKAECRRKAAEWLESGSDTPDIRLGKAWERFIDNYSLSHKITSTTRIDSRGKAHLRPLSKRIMSSISKTEWQKVIDDAYKNGATSRATLKGIASTIRTFCKWAAAQGYINDHDVPLYFSFPANATIKEKKILQPDQLKLLFEEDPDQWPYLYHFRFLAVTGLRRGELCALQRERDFDGLRITINESISHEGLITSGKTPDANRTILLTPIALEQIKEHWKRVPESRFVFSNPQGQRTAPKTLMNHWHTFREAHGIDLTLHELRHTFISYSRLKTGIDINELKELYGHANKMDTDAVYVHAIEKTPEELRAERRAAEKNAELINGVFEQFIS